MTETAVSLDPTEIIYPDSDGQPMADNTRQFDYIVMIQGGLAALFANRSDVFVAGDLLWYPVEGSNTIRLAPDAMVVFGRPPGHRDSYMQWREDDLAPQVVFEVLSPRNTRAEMARKRQFYGALRRRGILRVRSGSGAITRLAAPGRAIGAHRLDGKLDQPAAGRPFYPGGR